MFTLMCTLLRDRVHIIPVTIMIFTFFMNKKEGDFIILTQKPVVLYTVKIYFLKP